MADVPAGEFVARQSAQRLARRVLIVVCLAGAATAGVALRRLHMQMIEMFLVGPMFCGSVAMVGYAVRRARLRVDRDGVRWGWASIGFRMGPSRLRRVIVYRDAVALTPTRGSTWYLSRADWDGFERMPEALSEALSGALASTVARAPIAASAGIVVTHAGRRAPLRARLQSYGRVLDALLILAAVAAIATLLLALLMS